MLKKLMLTICLVLAFTFPVYAGEGEGGNVAGVYALGDHSLYKDKEGGLIFLSSNAQIKTGHQGDILVVGGNLAIESEITGTVYSLFSSIHIKEGGRVKELVSFSSKLTSPADYLLNFTAVPYFQTYQEILTNDGQKVLDGRIPDIFLLFIYGAIEFFLCMLFFSAKKSFMEQAAASLLEEPMQTAGNGVITYFILLALIIVFGLTVAFIPVALLFFLMGYALTLLGQAALGVAVGYIVLKKLNIRFNSLICLLAGLVVIIAVKNIPYITYGVTALIAPVFAIGAVVTALLNGFVNKSFYALDFASPGREDSNRESVRDILVK